MPGNEEMAEAIPVEDFRVHLRDMLLKLKIGKVILVDDLTGLELDRAAVMEALLKGPEAQHVLQPFFDGVDLDPLADALPDQLDALLREKGVEDIKALVAAMAGLSENAADLHDGHQLRELLLEGLEVEFLTPHQWAERKDELIGECTDEKLTLFLFDQDLNIKGEGLGFEEGADIIRMMMDEDPKGFGSKWFCGILSHTLKRGNEVTRWRELAAEANLGLQFFMPISKENLRDAGDFFEAVYRTLINSYCERLKSLASNALGDALQLTIERFKNIDPIEFEHMVVNSAEAEGASELDTMLRIFGLIQRDLTKAEILKEARFGDFSSAAASMKGIADYRRGLSTEAEARMAALIRQELYEGADLVNTYRDPLRNGDLFELLTDKPETWVLIVQPCDVVVRGNGERNRENTFKVAVLAPIRIVTGRLGQADGQSFELPRFGDDGLSHGIVEFAKGSTASLRVLDLAVLNRDGKCEFDPAAKLEGENYYSRGWQRRAQRLSDDFGKTAKSIADEIKKLKGGDKIVIKALLPRAGMGAKLGNRGDFKDGKFSYPLRRIGRVRDPLAASMLGAFGRYLSRDAFDHDFAFLPSTQPTPDDLEPTDAAAPENGNALSSRSAMSLSQGDGPALRDIWRRRRSRTLG